MKVALVHDYLKEPGGAEEVLETFTEMWPEAPIYTAYKFPKYWGRKKEIWKKWKIRESWGRWLPFADKLLSYLTVISPWFFKAMDLTKFDLVVISATGGYFPNGIKIGPKTRVVTYCHTPPRFLYGYETATKARNKWYWKPVSLVVNHFLRMVDFKLAQRPTVFVANSRNVRNRIWKFYRRKAEVVYPPIEMPTLASDLRSVNEKDDYFVIVSRIVGSKNIELGAEAANRYKFKLKIAGKAIGKGGEEIVRKISGPYVEYLGEVDEVAKGELLARAAGFLALERDADFGMTTVEPQIYGTPVVAYRNGGYLETVKEGKTGVFFDELTPEGIHEAIVRFNKVKWNVPTIKKMALRFSKDRFKKEMAAVVVKAME